ncbi:DUF4405 domain-containing protein, partial [candidate division KSB1 bacterium]|nr:DUF4405 domain-containing protein [candidate division KSB1 bacterium]
KEMWGALHINSSLVFFIIALLHLYYNWKVLWHYIKKKTELAINLKLEIAIAAVVAIFIVLATLYNIEPFRTIIKWNDDIKNYWATRAESEPPIPHAEDLTVTQFCEQFNISLDTLQNKLNQQGWKFDISSDKIMDIAQRNGISPAAIYNLLKTPDHNQQGQGSSGWGRKSLDEVCEELNIDAKEAIKKLASHGVNAKGDEVIKDLAGKNNLRPVDIVNMINTNIE